MKMLTKKECMDALNKMINTSYSRWYRSHGKTAKPYFLDGFYKNPVYKGDYKALKVIDKLIKEHFELLKKIKTGELSDGYHTFNELYYHRAILFSVILSAYPGKGWKSKKHNDGTMFDGMFIVGIDTPIGQYSYHYDVNLWSLFKVKELECAPKWDRHKPSDIDRLLSLNYAQTIQPYKFEDLKELIGKPIFDYKYKEFYILAEVKEEELYKDEGLEKIMICSDKKGLMRVYFEEGRFFPLTKALEY